ncbi:hypothetical protein GCM10007304_39500 [Rhodococcoides trifolii]|uniref:Glycoside hydrolase family 5 domain-containing protein n=1 Tax=Rhodococcoides trifolii TaxID=908250 RepID=A0A917G3U4_9NOCA|nr:hypothetical protein [Rhodococcus trifolii]GGG21774.1 hypothetical protein GCM10007304_39500 [Rhodococcus trifolii]
MIALRTSLRRLTLILILAIVATVGTVSVGSTPRAGATPADVGFSSGASMVELPNDELIGELDAMVAAGASWLRLDITWKTVETRPGQYDWSRVDNVVDQARSRGLTVLGLIGYAPGWSRPPMSVLQGPPLDLELFGRFAEVAATRYSSSITHWEIWNEPNHPGFFSPCPSVPVYFGLLWSAYLAIHRVQPSAVVVGGGLANRPDGLCSIAPKTFVDQLYAMGGGAFLDAVAVHPYTWPDTVAEDTRGYWNSVGAVHATMEANGDGGKKVWITEYGAPTGTAGVSEDRQAQIVVSGVQAARSLPYAGPIFVHAIRDRGTDPAATEDNYGLLRKDFSRKPAFDQLLSAN